MPMNTRWTLATLRAKVRQELMDPNGRWWSDTELNDYIGDWQNTLQDEFEPVWATTTATITSTSPVVLATTVPDLLRLDAIYWNDVRLTPTSTVELDELYPTWRGLTAENPVASYQVDQRSVTFFPLPTLTGTAIFEYPKKLGFAADSTAMALPAWMRYSAVNYASSAAFGRLGPNQDIQKSKKYEAIFDQQMKFYRLVKDRFFPQRSLSIRPGGAYEGKIINPINSPTFLSL
jgi:hypothetical protein